MAAGSGVACAGSEISGVVGSEDCVAWLRPVSEAVDGFYRFEERLTGNEVKREIHSKNVLSNPYRSAVFACLKKLVSEFHLNVTNQTMVGHISAIQKLYEMLVDSS